MTCPQTRNYTRQADLLVVVVGHIFLAENKVMPLTCSTTKWSHVINLQGLLLLIVYILCICKWLQMLSTLYCILLYCGNTSPGKIFTKTHIIVVNFHWICFSKLIVARSPTSQIWNKHISVSSLLIFGYVLLRGLSSACWCLAFVHSLGHFNVSVFFSTWKIKLLLSHYCLYISWKVKVQSRKPLVHV